MFDDHPTSCCCLVARSRTTTSPTGKPWYLAFEGMFVLLRFGDARLGREERHDLALSSTIACPRSPEVRAVRAALGDPR